MSFKRIVGLVALSSVLAINTGQAQRKDYPIQPVAFTHVHVHDNFWAPKMETNARVTIPHTLQKCRETAGLIISSGLLIY